MSTNSTEIEAADITTAIPDGGVMQLTDIPIDQLIPFKRHVFKPYGDQRMKTLIASIKENGIIHPVVVRRVKGKDYPERFEIISGHNRVEAARSAEIKDVPAVIKELSDDEAVILANEVNIESRSFQTWLPSEKIKSINQYHTAVKSQGKAKETKSTFGDKRQKSEDSYARQRTAQVYGLSPSVVREFIELSRLIEPLQERLDAKDFGTTPASEISFISADMQELINSVLNEDNKKRLYKVTIKRSEALRAYFENEAGESTVSENEEAIKDRVRKILSSCRETSPETVSDEPIRISISHEEFVELFPDDPSPEDVTAFLVKCARCCIERNLVSRDEAI